MDAIKQAKENKRNRFIKLCEIAKKVCDLLDAEGVTHNEGCKVRQMAESMWYDNISLSNAVCVEQPILAGG